MSQPAQTQYFATTSIGVQGVLERELRDMGVDWTRASRGGVLFRGDRRTLMAACHGLHTAHRVLWRIGEFDAVDADSLYRGVRHAARWDKLITPEHTLAVHATARNSAFNDPRYVALRTKDAIVDAIRDELGERPNVDRRDPDVPVHVRVVGTNVVISLDAAGSSLHERGYRIDGGRAPLRETLAAAIIELSGWVPDAPLVDLLCGSGTMLIEAALWARRLQPGTLGRSYAFERWPGHEPEVFDEIRAAAQAQALPDRPLQLTGFDLSTQALQGARRNAGRAGLDRTIHFERKDLDFAARALSDRHAAGWVVANPPWGERLGDQEQAIEIHRRLGQVLRRDFRGWQAWVVTADRRCFEAMEMEPFEVYDLLNGALPVKLFGFDLR